MLSRLDTANMWLFLRRADIGLILLTLGTVLIDRSFMAIRWICLLEAIGIRASRIRVVKIFFLSTFFGSFLPSGVGGEAVRALSFSRLTNRGVESIASVAMDRLLGMLSMLLIGLVSLTAFFNLYPHPTLLVSVVGFSVAAVVGMAVLLSNSLHERTRRWIMNGEHGWRAAVASMLEALARYRYRPGALLFVLALSVVVQFLRVLQAYLLSEAMSLGTPLVYFFCFIPVILLATMLPVSVGGWGTANLAYVALFSQVGMNSEGAFVLSIFILALGIFGNLPGGLIYAWEGFAASSNGPDNKMG